MKCPSCGSKASVKDTRVCNENQMRRRYVCRSNKTHKFFTIETITDEPVRASPFDRVITSNGTTQSIRQWAADLGIEPRSLVYRLGTQQDIEIALSKKKHQKS